MHEEQSELYRIQRKLALRGLLTKLPNFLIDFFSALVSSSLVMWLDVIDSAGNLLNAFLIARLSRKLNRNLKYVYNYGIGKIESIAGLFVHILELTGLAVIIIYALRDLLDPQLPGKYLLLPLLIKFISVISDALYAHRQAGIAKSMESVLSNAELDQYKRAVIFDVITFVTLLITYVFHKTRFATYFSSCISLILAIYFFIESIRYIFRSIAGLTDKSLPEDQQLLILKVLNRHYAEYSELSEINSHLNGLETTIDIHISFLKDTTYKEIQDLSSKLSEEINEVIPGSTVNLIINIV